MQTGWASVFTAEQPMTVELTGGPFCGTFVVVTRTQHSFTQESYASRLIVYKALPPAIQKYKVGNAVYVRSLTDPYTFRYLDMQ